ncbi:SCO1431 family membrane protein [Streptomyces sp. SID8379]|uniref:SCO1431 family membrane protein n=1 Tax=unclassified Streptomyces TaxID=2593676 RepID=UPI00037BB897|nr:MULTISPECIES: SCO1431 family membrane protein [unclassified Streptomyces]MYW64936.1 SCO1431 family membrane protein [Streptomyces sp. SID8379]
MTASSTTSATSGSLSAAVASLVARARTGGPKDEGPKILEHVLGWTFVVVLAMFVTQVGWM